MYFKLALNFRQIKKKKTLQFYRELSKSIRKESNINQIIVNQMFLSIQIHV